MYPSSKALPARTLLSLSFAVMLLTVLSYFFLDRPISQFFYTLQFYQSQPWLKVVTFLGLNLFVLAVLCAVLLYVQLFHSDRRVLWQCRFVFSVVFLSNVIGLILKITLGRARPLRWFEQGQYGFYGPAFEHDFWSMPSGHTLTLMALTFAFACLCSKYRWWFLPLAVLLISTRIILMKHYLSDIIFASLISYLVAHYLYYYRFKKYFVE
ncbi:MAG: phosphatase PAP2 family protein [Legionellaceae bacterium]|nr:phosphatase PAP2 family protein [Legionellaceae bacterium]